MAAACASAASTSPRAVSDGSSEALVEVDDERERLEGRRERCERPLGRVGRVGGHGRDRGARVGGSVGEHGPPVAVGQVARPDHGAHAGDRRGGGEVERRHARVRVRAAQDGGVGHPLQADVRDEPGRTRQPRGGRHPRVRMADDVQVLAVGVLGRGVVLDERPALLVAPLHLHLRAHEPGHQAASAARATARSMAG
jgi:hypothetical protein